MSDPARTCWCFKCDYCRSLRGLPPLAPCAHLGAPTGERRKCPTCKGHVEVKLHACHGGHGTCSTGKALPGVQCCTGCPDRVAGPRRPALQVESRSAGIGDHLLSLSVAEGLRRRYPGVEVVYAAPGWVHPWLRLFGGYDRLTATAERLPTCFCDNSGDWRAFTDAGLPRWQFWADKFGVGPVIPELRPIPAEAAAWAVPCSGNVLIAPFSAFAERTWPLQRWLDVEHRLQALGFEVSILDDRPDRCDRFASGGKLLGQSAEHVVAAVRAAAVLLGNDSGMAHVAGMSGAPVVAVASRVSDRRIMGLYPSVTELGGRRGGMEAVGPEDVVRAALDHVRRSVPADFPSAQFVAALHPADAWRSECWPPVYGVLWRTVRELAPRSIVEIGTRAGLGAWTMLRACPDATVHTIDLPTPSFDGLAGGTEHARGILAGRAVTFQATDSHELERVPECDLCYVDGDHSEEGCLADLELAERSGARAILVDDYAHLAGVRAAVSRFLAGRPDLAGKFIASQTGLYLIQPSGAKKDPIP